VTFKWATAELGTYARKTDKMKEREGGVGDGILIRQATRDAPLLAGKVTCSLGSCSFCCSRSLSWASSLHVLRDTEHTTH